MSTRSARSAASLAPAHPWLLSSPGIIDGSSRRPSHLDSDTGAIPSRAAAWLRLRDVWIATSRSVAASTSASEAAAWSRTHA